MQQIQTITFFKFSSWTDKVWAFYMMLEAPFRLGKVSGLSFFKLMGSGKNEGFNPFPDWSTYALLGVWDNEKNADYFFNNHPLMQRYERHTSHRWTIFMRNILAKGQWSGQEPFEKNTEIDSSNHYLAVITRATIRTRRLRTFWKYVPTSHLSLHGNTGLVYSKGIGETPIFQMATFSLWKNAESLRQFAYQSKEHHVAIQKTRELNWYKEELFSRFQPYEMRGSWPNMDVTALNNQIQGAARSQGIRK